MLTHWSINDQENDDHFAQNDAIKKWHPMILISGQSHSPSIVTQERGYR